MMYLQLPLNKNKKMNTIKKMGLKILGWALFIFMIGTLISMGLNARYAEAQAKSEYYQQIYNKEQYEACIAKKNLADAKLQDYANDLLALTVEDLNRLHGTKNLDCPLS